MIYGSMREMEVKDSKKYEIITIGEVVEIAFQEEIFCKRRVWRCVLVFGDRSSKISVEEYWDVFMGSKTAEFQSKRMELRRVVVCYM